MRNWQNIKGKLYSSSLFIVILILWQSLSSLGIVPKFMLPSPLEVILAFVSDFPLLWHHLGITLLEAFLGLSAGIICGFIFAVLMERFSLVQKTLYPLLVLTQTIPTVAIAPLLVLWFGFGILPKTILIFLVTFFPITVNLYDGFNSADQDAILLLKAMGAKTSQIFYYIKLPQSLPLFFSALKVSASYSIVGAVIAEWLGGSQGLGVYMTRVRKAYDFDKMFAAIFLISALSLLLLQVVKLAQRQAMPWLRKEK